MRLASFIQQNLTVIVDEWEVFAATLLPAASGMTSLALRDHAEEMLRAVAADMQTFQTEQEQVEKSMGRAKVQAASETAAQTHAVLRSRSGFDINQLVAEYRALRASVLKLWLSSSPGHSVTDDMIRFNEAIDQAIEESVRHFSIHVEQSRNFLLGMLGHDMRSPLNTILMTASYLTALNVGNEVSQSANILIRSGAAIKSLVDDLVDFNRTNLGLGINVEVVDTDLASVVREEVEQLRVASPDRKIELSVTGDCRCKCDPKRMQQVLRNLVTNAVKYGDHDSVVQVTLGGDDGIWLEVANQGHGTEQATLEDMFAPLRRGSEQPDGGLGLGLFIVREITRAHGGEIQVTCNDNETVFRISLPTQTPR